ncbi:uncharacterized protein LOC109793461 [Cajanus cajan]|uniref:uncharacterized protein LOC109793461 n=1 Tax=Cajanus cajan TaxID=3821 RepID=UPI00098D8D01|nr:uncharacterized protein LOC109793461 [Cajanus cajan]
MDPIKYLFEKPILTRRVSRWQVLLSEYDITYLAQKAIMGSALADYLANGPTDKYHAVKDNFPDKEVLALGNEEEGKTMEESWTMFFDEASKLMGNGVGTILMSSQGKHILVTTILDFDCTNNMAEYEACIFSLHVALDNGITRLEVYNDSNFVIH